MIRSAEMAGTVEVHDSKDVLASVASRFLKARTPPARLHSHYLECARFFVMKNARRQPALRIRGYEVTVRFEFRSSHLFKRDNLVARIRDNLAFGLALPTTDAAVSPIADFRVESGPLPLIIAPERRRRNRSQYFRSVLEHEIVHVNQQLLGVRVAIAKGATSLCICFT